MRFVPVVCLVVCALAGRSAFADLVGHWPFDGDALDASDYGHDGTPKGSISYVMGPIGTALHLDQSSRGVPAEPDRVVLGTSERLPVYNQPAYTVAFWVKGDPQPDRRVYSEGSGATDTPLFTIGTDFSGDTGRVSVFIRDAEGGGPGHVLSRGEAFDGTWHHVAWVDENGEAKLYIDGLLDRTFSYDKSWIPLDVAGIGGVVRMNPCCFLVGSVDDFRLYDEALGSASILELAERPDDFNTRFVLSFSGFESESTGSGAYTEWVDCVVTDRAPLGSPGAQGWSISLSSISLDIVEITTAGTVAAQVDDDPPGLRGEASFELSELTRPFDTARAGSRCDLLNNLGAVSAVVLSFSIPVTLPPDSTHVIARIRVSGEYPESGETQGYLWFVDGCAGSGQPVDNRLTVQGQLNLPSLGSASIVLRAGTGGSRFLRGDSNNDGLVDLSDAMPILSALFLGGPDPHCLAAANTNGDARVDVADPTYLLNYLFQGGPPLVAPFPACGTSDRESDEQLGCEASSCP